MPLLAYFITIRGYGTRLHGDDEGSVDRTHNLLGEERLPPNPARFNYARNLMAAGPMTFDARSRWVVDATIREVCAYRGWDLDALHVRLTHTHVVVSALPPTTPEKVMNDFKAYCTRRLVEAGLVPRGARVWSYHGSTRYLDTPVSFEQAVLYVRDQQGPPLPMVRPEGWTRSPPRGGG